MAEDGATNLLNASAVLITLILESRNPAPTGLWCSKWCRSSSTCHEDLHGPPSLHQGHHQCKVEFQSTFNSIRHDKMLCAVKMFIPNLLPYVHSAYSTDSILLWGNDRHDNFIGGYLARRLHIGALLFCLAIQDLVSSLRSEYITSSTSTMAH